MSTREPGVNQVIADILRGMRRRWKVQSEPGGAIRGGSKRPTSSSPNAARCR